MFNVPLRHAEPVRHTLKITTFRLPLPEQGGGGHWLVADHGLAKGKAGVRGLRNAVQSEASTQGKVFGTQVAQKALAPMGRNVSAQMPENIAPVSGYGLRRRGRPRKVNIDNVLPSGPVDAVVEGDGFKNSGRGRFAKGSQAAKDFMNRLRSMRGGKKPINGGSFLALGGEDNSRSLANMNTNGGSFRALGR